MRERPGPGGGEVVGQRPVGGGPPRLAELAGAPRPQLEEMTGRDLALLALMAPFWDELHEVLIKPGHPFVVDWSETDKVLGVSATPVDDVLGEVIPG